MKCKAFFGVESDLSCPICGHSYQTDNCDCKHNNAPGFDHAREALLSAIGHLNVTELYKIAEKHNIYVEITY